MARFSPFEPVLSGRALAFMVALNKRRQRKLSDLLFRLADYPYQPGDYESTDAAGRRVQHLRVGPLVISFWPDDATKELRITEIEEV